MDINITLFGEMLTFAVLVWVMMKYIWPPLLKAIQERQEKIAAGLEAAAQGHRELEATRDDIVKKLRQAKNEAAEILDHANQRAEEVFVEAKVKAEQERERLLQQAKQELEQQTAIAKEEIQQQTADLVVAVAEKVLKEKISAQDHEDLVARMIAKV